MILISEPTLPLGMMSGGIRDSLVTASSSWSGRPSTYGRLHWTKYSFNQCWAAGTSNTNQWLQIDLSRMEYLTAIATQGRHTGLQWVTSYYLSYGNDSASLNEYLEGGVRKVSTMGGFMESLLDVTRYHAGRNNCSHRKYT